MTYLFNSWGDLKKTYKDKQIFLFLDFDGTLTPIVEDPAKAVIPGKTQKILKELSKTPGCKLVVISGRRLKDIKKIIGIRGIIYSGNHGFEIAGPNIKVEKPFPVKLKEIFKQAGSDLKDRLSGIKGVFVEDKKFSISIHYRSVRKKEIPAVKNIFRETMLSCLPENRIKIVHGKMMLEIRPSIKWDKGKAVLWLLAQRQFAPKKERVPIYIGDDITDEDAFKALKNKGLTIFVGRPKQSNAEYYLKNTEEVSCFLRQILELKHGGVDKS